MNTLHDDFKWLMRQSFLKWLLIGSVSTLVLVYIATSPIFIKPLYRSEAVIYVPLTLFSQQFEQHGIGFASDAEIEGHIQILNSTALLDSLNKKFKLYNLWGIDMDSPDAHSRIYKRLRSRISLEKNRHNAVSITVSDPDAKRAADMANAIVSLGDAIKEDMLKENRLAAYRFAQELYKQQQAQVNELEEKLKLLNKAGQEQKLSDITYHNRLLITYEAEMQELIERKSKYDTFRKSFEASLPKSYIVSPAFAEASPSWPPRILLAVAAMFGYIILLIAIEIIRKNAHSA